MDTIDNNVMQAAAEQVMVFRQDYPSASIHTVTVTLNGQHGGVDVDIASTVDDRLPGLVTNGPSRVVELAR